jgi:hypothetical protein
VGVAFLVFGWGIIRDAPGVSRNLATGAYLAIAWGLFNWIPHTSMHITNAADDFGRLVLIEYVFHFTLILGALVLARFFWRILDTTMARPTVTAAPKPMVAR